MTSFQSLGRPMHLPPEATRRALIELRQAARMQLYWYFHGQQIEVDPAKLYAEAAFHLILIGDCEGGDHPRPRVIVDL